MIRPFLRRDFLAARLYHGASSARQDTKPLVKFANSRVGRLRKDRRHAQVEVKVNQDPESPVRYEPYSFAVTAENKLDCLKRVITPLFDVPYEEQLSSKESFCRNALRTFGQELYKTGTPVRLDVKRLPCHVNKIVRPRITTKYRNKDEFSIWRGEDGKTVTVGHMIFPIGKHGDTVCVEPNGCEVIKDETVGVVDLIQEFLGERAKLGVCFSLGTDGGWRRFMVRSNVDGELMVIGHLSPRTLRVREVLDERDNFKEFMVSRCKEVGLKLTSLYYQPCPNNHCLHRDVPYELLHGSKALIEKVGKFKFSLSPESYLHNSTDAAEILYKTMRDTIQTCFLDEDGTSNDCNGKKPLIINADCGSGPLAISLADMAHKVVGIDKSDMSIDEARESARINGVENVEFIASQFEIVFERIVEKYKREKHEIIVVCDTPNQGLNRNVLHVMRHNREINKLVLVVPKINSQKNLNNLLELCSNSQSRSIPPLAPILATPIDTCPHTEAFQTVIALERLTS